MTIPKDVTLVEGAIHNPTEPRHFMQVVPAPGQHIATLANQIVADSTNAIVVREVGLDIYDAVIYFPRGDVAMSSLRAIDKTTHCPLKGDTEYFDIVADDGTEHTEAAWSYIKMVAGDELRNLIAFDPSQVQVNQTSGAQL